MLDFVLVLALLPGPPTLTVDVHEIGPGRIATQAVIAGPRSCNASEQQACNETCRDLAFEKQGIVLEAKCAVNTAIYALSIGDVYFEDRSCKCTIATDSTVSVGYGY